jgi:myo-inositol-1-phosphate synthase
VRPARGKLAILTPGLGAVATTFIAGVESVRRGLSQPIGSLTQMATIRLGKRTENRSPLIKEFVPLAGLDDIVFGAWDPIPDDAYTAAKKAGVLEERDLEPIREFLAGIRPMPAAFENKYVTRINGTNVKRGGSKREIAEQLREDIRRFKTENGCDRVVLVWCGSTEIFITPGPQHQTIEAFEAALDANDEAIAPSMLYGYAAIMEGCAYANGAPNLAVDVPALVQLANDRGVAVSGKDFKTGQTWIKTVLAPGLKARMLGLAGWYSTNILGNRDGEVLDDPASFKTKESRSSRCCTPSCSPSSTRRCTRTSATSCASTTTRRAATTRKAGTTSTSSGGWATRCRSRSTSSAATRSSRRRSCSTSRCSATSRSAPG